MELLISKKEIENLIKKSTNIINASYGCNEFIIAELITIKLYNLIKNDFSLDNKYLNKVFKISSICSDINLADYDIEDIDILITTKNGILSGFVFGKADNSTDAFINIVKISNDLILPIRKVFNFDDNSVLIRPSIIEDLLESSNIKCILSLRNIAEKEINKRFDEDFKDKLSHNIFIASQLRKEKYLKLPIEIKDKLSKMKIRDDCSIGKYIHDFCKNSVSKSIQNSITEMLNKIENDFSEDMDNMHYLYEQISLLTDQLIIDCLHSKIQEVYLDSTECVLVDLMFVKEEIYIFNKEQQDKLARQRLVQSKIDKLNDIFDEINNEILSVYNRYTHKTFSISYASDNRVRCCYFNTSKRRIVVDGDEYRVNCFYFLRTSGYGFNLDPPLLLDNTLNLSISYRKKVIYSISEEKRNRLLEAQKDILSIIDINKNYSYIG